MKIIQLFCLFVYTAYPIFASEITLVRADQIMAGQETVSFAVCANVKSNTFERPVGYSVSQNSMEFIGHYHQSPFLKPFSVIQTPANFDRPYLLVDGHHTLRGTLELMKENGRDPESIFVPVKIDTQFKDYLPQDFWRTLKDQGLVYLGQKESLPCQDIMTLPNNELRAFLDATVVSFSINQSIIYAHPDHHLWIRIGGNHAESSIPFIEYYIAEDLEAAFFTYDSSTPITTELVTQARAILEKSRKANLMKLIGPDNRVLNSGLTIEDEYQAFTKRA